MSHPSRSRYQGLVVGWVIPGCAHGCHFKAHPRCQWEASSGTDLQGRPWSYLQASAWSRLRACPVFIVELHGRKRCRQRSFIGIAELRGAAGQRDSILQTTVPLRQPQDQEHTIQPRHTCACVGTGTARANPRPVLEVTTLATPVGYGHGYGGYGRGYGRYGGGYGRGYGGYGSGYGRGYRRYDRGCGRDYD